MAMTCESVTLNVLCSENSDLPRLKKASDQVSEKSEWNAYLQEDTGDYEGIVSISLSRQDGKPMTTSGVVFAVSEFHNVLKSL